MIQNKIKKHNIKKTLGTINYIFVRHFIDLKDYDKVYECWNQPQHKHWLEVLKNNNFQNLKLFDNLEELDFQTTNLQWQGYWFFKQRGDKRHIEFKIKTKTHESVYYEYASNLILLISPNEHSFVIKDAESNMPNKPVVKIIFDKKDSEILNKLF